MSNHVHNPPTWQCAARRCNGDQMCDECRKEVRLRTVAIRLLTAPGEYFDEVVSVDTQNGGSRGDKYARIEAFVERLRSGEIFPISSEGWLVVNKPLPTRVRTDSTISGAVGHGIYRCLGSGHRRRQDCNIGRG